MLWYVHEFLLQFHQAIGQLGGGSVASVNGRITGDGQRAAER